MGVLFALLVLYVQLVLIAQIVPENPECDKTVSHECPPVPVQECPPCPSCPVYSGNMHMPTAEQMQMLFSQVEIVAF